VRAGTRRLWRRPVTVEGSSAVGSGPLSFDIDRRFWYRLDHLDAAGVADVGEARLQRGVPDKRLDLADLGDANQGAAPEFCGVGHSQ
jgi:hypothetical protein